MSATVVAGFDETRDETRAAPRAGTQDGASADTPVHVREGTQVGAREGTQDDAHADTQRGAREGTHDDALRTGGDNAGDTNRTDAPISETTERFLCALLLKVPLDRIEELYLFSPLRQGAVETGIAVLAGSAHAPLGARREEVANAPAEPTEAPVPTEVHAAADMDVHEDGHDHSPYAAEPIAEGVDASSPTVEAADATLRVRHTVYTARYRLVIKGPDRGKWEIDVVDEADAPLLTVETVVRGVQRRSGDETSTVRYTAAQLARALRLPSPTMP